VKRKSYNYNLTALLRISTYVDINICMYVHLLSDLNELNLVFIKIE